MRQRLLHEARIEGNAESIEEAQTAGGDIGSSPLPVTTNQIYFQLVEFSAIDVKINYCPNAINLHAYFHEGDYLQLLNLFPLDGMELTLKVITDLQVIFENTLKTLLLFSCHIDKSVVNF